MFDTLVDKYINCGIFTCTYDMVTNKGLNMNLIKILAKLISRALSVIYFFDVIHFNNFLLKEVISNRATGVI